MHRITAALTNAFRLKKVRFIITAIFLAIDFLLLILYINKIILIYYFIYFALIACTAISFAALLFPCSPVKTAAALSLLITFFIAVFLSGVSYFIEHNMMKKPYYCSVSPSGKNTAVVFELDGGSGGVYVAYPLKYKCFYKNQDNGRMICRTWDVHIDAEWVLTARFI